MEYSVDHNLDGSYDISFFDDELEALVLLKTVDEYPSEEQVLAAISMYRKLRDA